MRIRNILLVVLLLAAVGAFVGYRLYEAKTPTASERPADLAVDAQTLYDAFVQDETAAGARYNDKVVQVSGIVRDITTEPDGRTNVMIETGDALGAVVCEFAPGQAVTLRKNDPASIKGFCAGYNMDVLLQRCSMADQPSDPRNETRP